MSKQRKSTAPNIPAQSLARARAELAGTIVAPALDDLPNPEAPAPKKGKNYHLITTEDLKHEYVYVVNDIRNMAILAALLFVAMVVIAVAAI
jgi:hypothetical protein